MEYVVWGVWSISSIASISLEQTWVEIQERKISYCSLPQNKKLTGQPLSEVPGYETTWESIT